MKTVFTEMLNRDEILNTQHISTHFNIVSARSFALQADGAAAALPWGYGDHADEKPLQVATDMDGAK